VLVALGCREEGIGGPVDCPVPQPRADGGQRILFIGNSLTYTNNLPLMVRALADSAGAPPPQVDESTLPNFSLTDHLSEGTAARLIHSECWDYVVLQQGPSSLGDSRTQLLDAVRRFARVIREQGAVPAMFSVWPSADRFADFPRAIESYRMAAESVDGVMLPAATAWLEAWERDPELDLYSDGLHPSRQGSYVAALVIVGRLYGVDPRSLPPGLSIRADGREVEMRFQPAVADVLREAAHEALALP
jgi:hypothetical protein